MALHEETAGGKTQPAGSTQGTPAVQRTGRGAFEKEPPPDNSRLRHRTRRGNHPFYGFGQLVEPERLVEHLLEAGLAGFDNRMARIVPEAAHQHQRNHVEQLPEPLHQIETGDDVFVGVIGRETSEGITLRTGVDEERFISRASITSMTASTISVMPEGLDSGLSDQELLDLITFLQTLDGNGFLEPAQH